MSTISNSGSDVSGLITYTMSGETHQSVGTTSNREYDFLDFLGIAQSLKIDFLPITWQPALDRVGEGGTAEIREALVNLQMTFAFKRIKFPGSALEEARNWSALVAEILILGHPAFRHHRNIATLEGICWDVINGGERVWPVLVFEKTRHGDLERFMTSGLGIELDFKKRLDMLLDIALAIRDLHAAGVIHGDIKPENILIFPKSGGGFMARVTDFGYSTLFATDTDLVTMPKSDLWTAPEHHRRQVRPTQARKMDVFSFGMLCLWLLFYNIGSNRDGNFKKDLKETHLEVVHYGFQKIKETADPNSQGRVNIRRLFSLSLSQDPDGRTSDFGELLKFLSPNEPITPSTSLAGLVLVPHEDFRVAPLLAQLFEAHYSVRYYIARCLEERNKRQSISYRHALNLAFCYRIGIGVPKDMSRCQSLVTEYGILLRDLEDLVKQTLGNPQPPEYHQGSFKTLLERGHIPAFDVSQQYREEQLLDEAELRYQREVETLRSALGDDHRIVQELRRQLSLLMIREGRWQDAENLQLQMIEFDKKIIGEGQYLGRFASYLAETYINQWRWKEAEELEIQIMETRRKIFGVGHSYTQKSIANLVSIYINQERWEKAEELGSQIMENWKTVFGVEHPSTLTSISNLALIYKNQRRWIEAEKLDIQVMEMSKRVFGAEHPRTLHSMANLTSTYKSQKQWKKAEELDLQVMETSKRVLGADHPHTLHSITSLSLTYKNQKRWQEAERLDIEAMEISKRVLGAEHLHTLENVSNLASTYRGQGRWKEAEELDLKAIETKNSILKESDLRSPLSKFHIPHRDPDPRNKIRTVVLSPLKDRKEQGKSPREAWRNAASGICKFPNLSSVHIRFREPYLNNEANGMNGRWTTEDTEFQIDVLKTVFATLNGKGSPMPNFRSLSIKNLQSKNDVGIADSPNFKAVISKLAELHLAITTEDLEGRPENNIDREALHEFFKHGLLSFWLRPVSRNLTHLTLHANTYWGWTPAFDPRGLRFPKLKYLALGNHTFAHDWQIDWITSHFAALETLVLRNCPIVFYIFRDETPDHCTPTINHEDHNKLLVQDAPESLDSGLCHHVHWVYNSRWHDFFPKLQIGLPNLTKFVYAHGEWQHTFDGGDAIDGNDGIDGSEEIPPTLQRKRYIAFNGGTRPSRWEELRSELETTYENLNGQIILKTPAVAEPPYEVVANEDGSVGSKSSDVSIPASNRDTEAVQKGCQMEDEKAFHSLLKTVARRAKKKGIS